MFPYTLGSVISTCGFYGSTKTEACLANRSKDERDRPRPFAVLSATPLLPRRRWGLNRHLGTLQMALGPSSGAPSGEQFGRKSRTLVLKVWSSTSATGTTWNLSEMQNPRPHPGLQNQKLRGRPSSLCFHKPSRRFQYKLKFEKPSLGPRILNRESENLGSNPGPGS